ncbi:hypothetical protein MHBO_002553 [Bonamia ostreae]|uniref:Uncharacterized protein n=1 Tax=Bonamia ostreae TaxID=126728 RepID=A0ABV2AMT2_9EUKA
MQNEKLSQNDASFLLRTISSMWKDQVPIKDAWNCVKDISKKIANSRDAKNPLNKSADDILESKQISLQKPNYQVLDKPSPEKPKITDNRLSPEKSETVLQNGDFSEYSISQEEYYDESDENDINGRYDFSISMDRDQNSDSSNDIRKVKILKIRLLKILTIIEMRYFFYNLKDDSEESEGDSPGLNLAEHDENKPTINVSAFRRILRNNLYDVNRDDRNQDEILEALKDENKIGSKFDSKMRKIFDTPKNYESMSNDNEPVGTTEETECRRCTYSFPLTDKNCPMCGAAKNYEEPELWRCARCNSENGFKGKNKLFCEFCYSKET